MFWLQYDVALPRATPRQRPCGGRPGDPAAWVSACFDAADTTLWTGFDAAANPGQHTTSWTGFDAAEHTTS